tara:strand:- start:1168 stop:2109 length:942 start_codon:yes stop_codon:yes gene_type:complete
MQEDETKETIIELEDETVEEEETESVEPESQPKSEPEPEPESEPEPDIAASAEEGEQSEEELESYSEGVQRRIRKLTAKYREEERQKQAAVEFAENVQQQNKDLEQQLKEREESYVGVYGGSIEREVEAAKAAYKTAHDEGDADALFAAQQRISQLALEQSKYEEAKLKIEKEQASTEQAVETPQQAAPTPQAAAPQPDPKAQAWADKNSWFGEDESMTYAAFGIHRRLVEEEGFDASSDDYYSELDKRLRADFPNKFEAPKKRSQTRVASADSTASRSSKKGRRTVKLTESQVAIARKLGVPLEEYAKYVKE